MSKIGQASNMERRVASVATVLPARGLSWCSRHAGIGGCSSVIDLFPPPARPDPSIYGQAPLIAAGVAATWDNPDIALHEYPLYTNGAWRFDPAPGFNAKVTVRNKSLTAAAINTVVAVSYGRRGI